MAKKKKEVLLTPEQKLEADYQKAVRRMEGAEKMLQAEDRMHMYREAVKLFTALGDYADSRKRREECERILPQKRAEFRAEVYRNGMELKNNAKTEDDYEAAIEEFQRLKVAYKDIPQQIEACEQLKIQAKKRAKGKKLIKSLLALGVVAAAAALVLYLRTPAAFYKEGCLLMQIGDYERAGNLFAHSLDYADTRERLVECNYERALTCEQEGDDKRAVMLLEKRVGDYRDAQEKKAALEQKIYRQAQPGDVVPLGDAQWIVADKQNGKALLIRQTPMTADTVYEASGDAVTWEQSDMRAWLNGAYMQEHFSGEEQAFFAQTNLAAQKNSVYGTDGGRAVTDAVFLPDAFEAQQYGNLLKNKKNQRAWWLRTPGKTADSAAFVSADGHVMAYGYAVDAPELAVRPAVWVNVEEQ